jgi:hypothetical protein
VAVAALVGSVVCVAASVAATLHVPWEYPTISVALDVASAGDTVLVAPGTYTDTTILQYRREGGDGTFTVMGLLKDGVVLKSEAGPETTILDMSGATIEGWGIYLPGYDLNSGGTVIEGFTFAPPQPGTTGMTLTFSAGGVTTIRNCHFSGFDMSGSESYGGALFVSLSQVAIEDCTFEDCAAYSGGAIWAGDSLVWLDRTTFTRCTSLTGALTSLTVSVSNGRLVVNRCEFLENDAPEGAGGAIWMGSSGYASLTIAESWFADNVADYGGAVLAGGTGDKLVSGCVFVGNVSHISGGALSIGDSSVEVSHNTFYGNVESGGKPTASALRISGSCRIGHNIFSSNSGSPAVALVNGTNLVDEACNSFWSNPDGDVDGFVPAPTDIFVDPLFCDAKNDNFTLSSSSPCLPSGNEDCGLIGALGQGCGSVSIDRTSWGRLKSMYRGLE